MNILEPDWDNRSLDIISKHPYIVKLNKWHRWKLNHLKWWYVYIWRRWDKKYGW